MGVFEKNDRSTCISCSVESCLHHSIANRCTAPQIKVCGKNAKSEEDTICGTYCKKDGSGMC